MRRGALRDHQLSNVVEQSGEGDGRGELCLLRDAGGDARSELRVAVEFLEKFDGNKFVSGEGAGFFSSFRLERTESGGETLLAEPESAVKSSQGPRN